MKEYLLWFDAILGLSTALLGGLIGPTRWAAWLCLPRPLMIFITLANLVYSGLAASLAGRWLPGQAVGLLLWANLAWTFISLLMLGLWSRTQSWGRAFLVGQVLLVGLLTWTEWLVFHPAV